MVLNLLQLRKTHVDWVGKLPWCLNSPREHIEWVWRSKGRMKTIWLCLPWSSHRSSEGCTCGFLAPGCWWWIPWGPTCTMGPQGWGHDGATVGCGVAVSIQTTKEKISVIDLYCQWFSCCSWSVYLYYHIVYVWPANRQSSIIRIHCWK